MFEISTQFPDPEVENDDRPPRRLDGVQAVLAAGDYLTRINKPVPFARGYLTQLQALSQCPQPNPAFAAAKAGASWIINAATGQYRDVVGRPMARAVDAQTNAQLEKTLQSKHSQCNANRYIGYLGRADSTALLVYFKADQPLSAATQNLFRLLTMQAAIAYENVHLHQEIIDTQKEVMTTLGQVMASRSQETGNHVRRVAEFSFLLARKAGLSKAEAELLRLAAPMHDVGKVGVPDAILAKADLLTREEFETIRHHTTAGYEIFKNSRHEILAAAEIVARQHHERWDGEGYPRGLKGRDIHIFGRIVAMADVFDALVHYRIYKKAWLPEQVIAYFRSQRGRQFDPELVDIFLCHSDTFFAISRKLPDC